MPWKQNAVPETAPADLLDVIRRNGGARGYDDEMFLAGWIVAGVVAGRDGQDAIDALESHVDAIYRVTRGILMTGTDRATIEACYARRAQVQNAMRTEWIEDVAETGKPLPNPQPSRRFIDANAFPGAWRKQWRQMVGLEADEFGETADFTATPRMS